MKKLPEEQRRYPVLQNGYVIATNCRSCPLNAVVSLSTIASAHFAREVMYEWRQQMRLNRQMRVQVLGAVACEAGQLPT
jgi:hypothetical protein